jgi:adenylosuccinate synthase
MDVGAVVLDVGYGDAGKGIVCNQLLNIKHKNLKCLGVRFSGTSQCGHTVYKEDKHHIHRTYTSGAIDGFDSYLTEDVLFNPMMWLYEKELLKTNFNINPKLYVHPLSLVITPFDMKDDLEGNNCGVGNNETMQRSKVLPLYFMDLFNRHIFKSKLDAIESYYPKSTRTPSAFYYKFFIEAIDQLDYKMVKTYEIFDKYYYGCFEGSQGILLDKSIGAYPNVTNANTTSVNLLKYIDLELVDKYYVTRCYGTRHGNGPIPNNEKIDLQNTEFETNVYNKNQGHFRTFELDYDLINHAINADLFKCNKVSKSKNLVVTCMDQRPDFKFQEDKVDVDRILYNSTPKGNMFL